MFRRFLPFNSDEPLWGRLISLGTVLFLVLLSDAILSFWVPNFVQTTFKSSIWMGLILSFSSMVGFATDIVLPQLLKGISVRKLFIYGIATNLIFTLLLLQSSFAPILAILLVAMAIWGLYYEFLGFALQQFVSDTTPLQLRSSAWAILGLFRNLAYFLGPLIASWFIVNGQTAPLILALLFGLVSLAALTFSNKIHDRPVGFDLTEVNIWKELEHWRVLLRSVWPVIILSIFLGLIDATFWTTGTVLTESLARKNWLGGFFLPFYTLPSLFVGFMVAHWHIYKGKKKLAEKLFVLAGVFLGLIGVSESVYWALIMVFVSSFILAIVYPLIESVYTDIVVRMGRERRHMIGLTNSTSSIAYIIGPILAGVIANFVGEKRTFGVVGIVTILVGIILLLVTPKKFALPQTEIHTWAD